MESSSYVLDTVSLRARKWIFFTSQGSVTDSFPMPERIGLRVCVPCRRRLLTDAMLNFYMCHSYVPYLCVLLMCLPFPCMCHFYAPFLCHSNVSFLYAIFCVVPIYRSEDVFVVAGNKCFERGSYSTRVHGHTKIGVF